MVKKILSTLFCLMLGILLIVGVISCKKELPTFHVNFMVDGETYATVTTSGKEMLVLPKQPTKEKNVFEGWFADDGIWQQPFTTDSLLDTQLNADMSVYAKWGHAHTVVVDPAIEATDTTDGLTKGQHCSDCGEVLVAQQVIPAFLQGTDIKSNQMTVVDDQINASLSNATDHFSFLGDLTVAGGASYVIARDANCEQLIEDQTVTLQPADNVFYILVTNGDAQKLYTVTLRRRPIYTVSFLTAGGTEVSDQHVEEGSLAERPTTTRKGYTLAGWDHDFTAPIMESTTITASWRANTNTPYRVECYLQNFGDDTYTYHETVNKQGTTDAQIKLTSAPKQISHYTFDPTHSDGVLEGVIDCDGTLVLKAYYKRNVYTLSNANTQYGSITVEGEFQWGSDSVTATATAEDLRGYGFLGWYSGSTLLSTEPTYTFTAEKNVEARFGVKQEMSYFTFTSTAEECCITGMSNKMLTSVVIPHYVTAIGANAFYDCVRLTSVTFGADSQLSFIGAAAFHGCYNLTSVAIPSGVTTIGDYAFRGCRALESITVADGNTYYFATGNCLVETASRTLLLGCKSSVIPTDGSVTSIGSYAFLGATFTSIDIPSSITSIGDNAFNNCRLLTHLTLPSSVTSIGSSAFVNCMALTSFTIPSLITSIGASVFEGCSNLTSVTIPSSITSIGEKAFLSCSSLAQITIPNSVLSIGDSAFQSCGALTQIAIPSSVLSIGDGAFRGCGNLTQVTLPTALDLIGDYTFYGCKKLSSITIPSSVSTIGSYAFFDCSGLAEISIPNGVTSIGGYAFSNCVGLLTVAFDTDSRLASIGEWAFSGCTALSTVTLPNAVGSIGDYAFRECTALSSVTLSVGLTTIGDWIFLDCTAFEGAVYPGTQEKWNAIAKGDGWDPTKKDSYKVTCTGSAE